MQVTSDESQPFQLLQLPGPALNCVLQKLDPCSLACTAVVCSKLSHAVPASVRSVAVIFTGAQQDKLDSLPVWLERHGSSITQCSVEGVKSCQFVERLDYSISFLPCPQLRSLSLKAMDMQLAPAGNSPGVLQDCTRLTALRLDTCADRDPQAAFAAIAALPELRSLVLIGDEDDVCLSGELQLLTQVTLLALDVYQRFGQSQLYRQLRQLSALANLQELGLRLPAEGLPGGLPTQLQKLTRLAIVYHLPTSCDSAEQFQHLSSLTALQDLVVTGFVGAFYCMFNRTGEQLAGIRAGDLAGIQHLSQLTSLQISCPCSDLSTTSTSSWAESLTALERLNLSRNELQADVLVAFTQLRALSVWEVKRTAPFDDMLLAVSGLPQLTELCITIDHLAHPPVTQAACTALTVGTNLCSLQLSFGGPRGAVAPGGCELFTPGAVYPYLRVIDLQYDGGPSSRREPVPLGKMPVTALQLQQLCSCCPAVESLSFAPSPCFPPAAFAPLLQLSALSSLEFRDLGALATAAVGVAAQLTGLKQLVLRGLPELKDPALMQLTALTALEKLMLENVRQYDHECRGFLWKNKARCGNPPDVWMQLQHHLQEVDEPAGPAGVGQAPAGPVGQASTGPVGQAPAGLEGLDQAPIGPVGQAPTGPVGQAHVGPVGPADLGQALTSTVGQVPAGLGKALPKRRTKPVAAPGP